MRFRKSSVRRIWLGSIIYLVALILGMGFVFPDLHLPAWLEVVLKITAVLAFAAAALLPLAYLATATHAKAKKQSKALIVAGYVTVLGYVLLLFQILYVKIKTCDANAVPHDERWHCNVSGKGLAVYFVAVPILAAIVGLVYAGLERLGRPKSKD